MRHARRKRSHGIGHVVASWAWALLPLVTLGFGTAPCMIYAALHKRNAWQGMFAGLYTAGLIVMLLASISPDGSFLESEFGPAVLWISCLAGGGHALAIRHWVFFDMPASVGRHARSAGIVAMEEAAARREALRIVESDANLAVELKIGRIDMPDRAFPDGGLIDVNNVPAWALEQATELPGYLCRRITKNRTTVGGYQSAAKMSVTLHLPPNVLDTIEDRLVFLPQYEHAT